MNWVWSLLFLPLTLVISGQIKASRSIAGVSHVSYFNDDHKPDYAFNASEAREICSNLERTLASQAQVQNALAQGLETCRFGWVDEHFALIPRIKASLACGNNNTGLVKWRAAVFKKFDAFCFNESDMIQELKDATTDNPSSTGNMDDRTTPTSNPKPRLSNVSITSPSSHLSDTTSSANSPQPSYDCCSLTTTQQPQQGVEGSRRALLIVSSCILLLTLISILAYVKLNKVCFLNWDVKHQEAAVEWTSVNHVKDPQSHTEEEVTIEVDTNTS